MVVESVNGGSASKPPPTRAEEAPVKPRENERRAEKSEADVRAQDQTENPEREPNSANGVGENVDIKT